METLTKSVPSPSTDRLRHALSALASLLDQTSYEVQNLDSEFQQMLVQAAEDAEASAHKQGLERLQVAVEEAERKTRVLVTEELKTQFAHELSREESVRAQLNSEREELQRTMQRLTQAAQSREEELRKLASERDRAAQMLADTKQSYQNALAETEEAAALALERQITTTVERVRAEGLAETEQLRTELAQSTQSLERSTQERDQLAAELDQVRRLLAESEAEHSRMLSETRRTAAAAFERQMDRVRSELTEECDRLRQELEQLARSAAQWNTERNRLNAELERANRLVEETRTQPQPQGSSAPEPVVKLQLAGDALQAEIGRVEGLIKSITKVIDDPATELSVVFRKNAERTELESYLRGIRFSLARR